MSDPDKPMEEQKPGKGRRRGATIDLTAEEVRTSSEAGSGPMAGAEGSAPDAGAGADGATATNPAAMGSERADVIAEEPVAVTTPEPEAHAADAAPEETASRVEPLQVPPAPENPRPSLALPLFAAATLGLVFGGAGGAIVPALLGGNNADSARLQIIDRTQQQLAKDQAGLASMVELEKVRQTVTKLEAAVAQLGSSGAAAGAGVAPVLEARIAELETGLKDLANRPAPAPAAPPQSAPAAPAIDLGPLRAQIATLQGRLADLDAAAAERRELQTQATALDGQVKALDGAIKALTGRIDTVAKAAEAAPGAAAQTVTAAVEPIITAIGQRVEKAEARIEAGRAAPLFAAVQALAQTFHRGAPFASELTAAEALGAPAEQLQPLRPFAERGAPTPQRLQEAFAQIAGKLAGDASQPGVMGYVSRFVTVRPTEESASGTPAAIVGSIEGRAATRGCRGPPSPTGTACRKAPATPPPNGARRRHGALRRRSPWPTCRLRPQPP